MVRTRPDDLWLEVGILTKPHGLSGAYQYKSHSDTSNSLTIGAEVRLVARDKSIHDLTLSDVRPYGRSGALLTFAELRERADLERLRGAALLLRRADLGPLAADEVFVSDLIGLEAFLPGGEPAGRVIDAVDTGPVISLVIAGAHPGTVPYHDDWVGDPDFDAGTIMLKRGPIV